MQYNANGIAFCGQFIGPLQISNRYKIKILREC